MHRLHISEHFGPTLQGEGNTVGMPAIFWRFKGCVLTCSYCDTIEVWKKGISYTFDEAYRMFADAGYFTRLTSMSACWCSPGAIRCCSKVPYWSSSITA